MFLLVRHNGYCPLFMPLTLLVNGVLYCKMAEKTISASAYSTVFAKPLNLHK